MLSADVVAISIASIKETLFYISSNNQFLSSAVAVLNQT